MNVSVKHCGKRQSTTKSVAASKKAQRVRKRKSVSAKIIDQATKRFAGAIERLGNR